MSLLETIRELKQTLQQALVQLNSIEAFLHIDPPSEGFSSGYSTSNEDDKYLMMTFPPAPPIDCSSSRSPSPLPLRIPGKYKKAGNLLFPVENIFDTSLPGK
jgi:hypothetical protein